MSKNILITESQFKSLVKESAFPDTSVVTVPFGRNPERYYPADTEARYCNDVPYDRFNKSGIGFKMPKEFGSDEVKKNYSGILNTKFGSMVARFSDNCALFDLRPDFELKPEQVCRIFRKDGYDAECVGDNKLIRVFYENGDKQTPQMLKEDTNINIKIKGNRPVNPEKVKAIVNYIDKTFKRGSMNGIDDNGFPKTTPIVAMLGTAGDILMNMTAPQMFYHLQDRFKHLSDDKVYRDDLLKQIIKDWYPHKISKEGLLTVNMI